MTIEEYLQATVGLNFVFPEATILAAMLHWGIEPEETAFQPDRGEEWTRKVELAQSDLWFALSTATSGGSETKTLGNRSYTKTGNSNTKLDRQAFRDEANRLREKWDEDLFADDQDIIFDANPYWK